MFMYIPEQMKNRKEIGYGALNLLNEINLRIRDEIKESGDFYVHGFPIPSSSFVSQFPPKASLQVLRIMNGNPFTEKRHVEQLLTRIVEIGDRLAASRIGRMDPGQDIRKTALFTDFIDWLNRFMGQTRHISVVYGSSVYQRDFFKSDIDLMLIAEDSFCTPHNLDVLVAKVVELHRKHGLPLDEEIPYHRKLLVPYSLAESALDGVGFELNRYSVTIPEIVKTPEFLASPEMVARLIVNALSTKNVLLSGEYDGYYSFRLRAARLLVWVLLKQLTSVSGPDDIVTALYEHEGRAGENFLGYKRSAELDAHLRPLISQVFQEMVKKQEVLQFGEDYMLAQAFDLSMIQRLREHTDSRAAAQVVSSTPVQS